MALVMPLVSGIRSLAERWARSCFILLVAHIPPWAQGGLVY